MVGAEPCHLQVRVLRAPSTAPSAVGGNGDTKAQRELALGSADPHPSFGYNLTFSFSSYLHLTHSAFLRRSGPWLVGWPGVAFLTTGSQGEKLLLKTSPLGSFLNMTHCRADL